MTVHRILYPRQLLKFFVFVLLVKFPQFNQLSALYTIQTSVNPENVTEILRTSRTLVFQVGINVIFRC